MRWIYSILGLLALGLGGVGAVLPLLPTTPLLLLAAFCFAKSSPGLHAWFKGTKLYRNNLESFVRGQGMTKRTKLRILFTVTLLMAIAFIAMKGTEAGRICLAVVWGAHVAGILFVVKNRPEDKTPAKGESDHDA